MEAFMSYRFQPGYDSMYGGGRTSVVKGLIIANVVFFVLQIIAALAMHTQPGDDLLTRWLGLTPYFITKYFFVWQIVTAMFLHGDVMHIAFNMLGLYFFGRELEMIWSKRRFLMFFFGAGIIANIFVYLLNIYGRTPTIGASGAVLALLGAYAALYPDRTIILYMFPVKVKWVAIGYFILSVYGVLFGGGGISHAAHLAGIVIGVGYIKFKWRALDDFTGGIKERLRLWRLRRKYSKFRVVDGDVKKMWDDLEDKINHDGRNRHIN
jgi:membrane associated rhomboid family serine protease